MKSSPGRLDSAALTSWGLGICDGDSHEGSGTLRQALGPELAGRGFDLAAAAATDISEGWFHLWGVGSGRGMGLTEGSPPNPCLPGLLGGGRPGYGLVKVRRRRRQDRGGGWGQRGRKKHKYLYHYCSPSLTTFTLPQVCLRGPRGSLFFFWGASKRKSRFVAPYGLAALGVQPAE